MPNKDNRKRKTSDIDEFNDLKVKLKRLERKMLRGRRSRVVYSSSEKEYTSSPSPARDVSRDASVSRARDRYPRSSRARERSDSAPRPARRHRSRKRPERGDNSSAERNTSAQTSPDRGEATAARSRRRHRSPSDVRSVSRSRSADTPEKTQEGDRCNEQTEVQIEAESSANQQTEPSTSAVASLSTETPAVDAAADGQLDLELSGDLLEILGEDPSTTKKVGKDIQKDLAVRLEHIVTNGLTKEIRKELREKYPVPANCVLIDAPQVNPEVKAAISETSAKRLKGMEYKQKQLASAISCLSQALSVILNQKDWDPNLLKLLMDAVRLICDSQYSDSLTRRFFILASLKKEMKEQLLLTKIDTFLFGKDLSETLKSAKAICKSGAELKQTVAKQTVNKTANNKTYYNNKNNSHLNKKTPPSRRSTGSSRPQEPAPKNQPVSSSRTSRYNTKRSRR